MANDTLMRVPVEGVQILVTRGIASRLAELDVTLTPTGLSYGKSLNEAEMWELGEVLLDAQRATSVPIKWGISDWYNGMVRTYGDRKTGLPGPKLQKMESLAKRYGIGIQTIRNFGNVGRYFTNEINPRGLISNRRRAFVGTWSLYEALATPEWTDQDRQDWLDREERNPGTVTVARVNNERKMLQARRESEARAQQRIEEELKQPLPIPTVDIEADQNVLIDEASGIEYHTAPVDDLVQKYGAPPPLPPEVKARGAAILEHQGGLISTAPASQSQAAVLQEWCELLGKTFPTIIEDVAKKQITPKLWLVRAIQGELDKHA